MPPEDGIYGYTFAAQPPGGIAAQVLTPIVAVATRVLYGDMKGVRIHASSNSMEAMIDKKTIEFDCD